MEDENLNQVGKKLSNRMERSVIERYPEIREIKNAMLDQGALGALMSGSGSSVFGLFQDKEGMDLACKELKKRWKKIYMVETI